MQIGISHWLSYVEEKHESDWVKCIKHSEVEGRVAVGTSIPKKNWMKS